MRSSSWIPRRAASGQPIAATLTTAGVVRVSAIGVNRLSKRSAVAIVDGRERSRAWNRVPFRLVPLGDPLLLHQGRGRRGMPPAFLAWIRVTIAAILLGALSRRLGLLDQLRGRWRPLAVYALIEIAFRFPLIGFGSSGSPRRSPRS